ncbi:hypothetical protein ACVWY5_001344 [Bradyrhizobium sp. USDA 3256]
MKIQLPIAQRQLIDPQEQGRMSFLLMCMGLYHVALEEI